ncbi:hypothetical protein EVAR_58195_1 [Eumeta japonica]|uniref:Uncharacterized protein n=1 Tax=Eumeta variegata TaxID=151549 RepID=A0A4C1YVQ1_EUMVA|nr:hypothetical protein EVAR_58195_1 [Eumeta japonica]
MRIMKAGQWRAINHTGRVIATGCDRAAPAHALGLFRRCAIKRILPPRPLAPRLRLRPHPRLYPTLATHVNALWCAAAEQAWAQARSIRREVRPRRH